MRPGNCTNVQKEWRMERPKAHRTIQSLVERKGIDLFSPDEKSSTQVLMGGGKEVFKGTEFST